MLVLLCLFKELFVFTSFRLVIILSKFTSLYVNYMHVILVAIICNSIIFGLYVSYIF